MLMDMRSEQLIQISFMELPAAKDVEFMASWAQVRDERERRDDDVDAALYRSLAPEARFRFVTIVHHRLAAESSETAIRLVIPSGGMPYPSHGGLYRVEREDRSEGEHTGHVALIDPFQVAPDTDPIFLAGWDAARLAFRDQPGYLATALHRSVIPTVDYRFVNVALWNDAGAYEQALHHPGFSSAINMLRSHVRFTSHPALYELVPG